MSAGLGLAKSSDALFVSDGKQSIPRRWTESVVWANTCLLWLSLVHRVNIILDFLVFRLFVNGIIKQLRVHIQIGEFELYYVNCIRC